MKSKEEELKTYGEFCEENIEIELKLDSKDEVFYDLAMRTLYWLFCTIRQSPATVYKVCRSIDIRHLSQLRGLMPLDGDSRANVAAANMKMLMRLPGLDLFSMWHCLSRSTEREFSSLAAYSNVVWKIEQHLLYPSGLKVAASSPPSMRTYHPTIRDKRGVKGVSLDYHVVDCVTGHVTKTALEVAKACKDAARGDVTVDLRGDVEMEDEFEEISLTSDDFTAGWQSLYVVRISEAAFTELLTKIARLSSREQPNYVIGTDGKVYRAGSSTVRVWLNTAMCFDAHSG